MVLNLVSVTEIAEMLGVSRQRVNQLIHAYADFPEAEADLAIGRVWLRSAVQSWADSHPRTPGRRPSPANAPNQTSSEKRHPPSGGVPVARGGRKPRDAQESPTAVPEGQARRDQSQ